MEPRTCTRLLLSLLAFSCAPVLRCCEVRNASGDATVANCTDQSAREFLRSFNATAWENSTGLSLDFSYLALVHDLYVQVLTRWTNERSDLATSQTYYRGDVEIQGALHEGLSNLTNLESFSLNLHATMLDRMLYGRYGVCGNPFPIMPSLRSLAFNFSGNPFQMPQSYSGGTQIGYEHEQVNMVDGSTGRVHDTFDVAGLFAASEVQEIGLDLSYTNIQFPVQVYSMPAPDRTWPLRSLVLDVSGTKISGPVLLFTGAAVWRRGQTTSRPPTTTRSGRGGWAHPTQTPSAQEQEWKETRNALQITGPAARFAHLSRVDIKAAGLRLGDASIRDLVVGLASLPALEALALDLSHNDISDLGLRDVYGASQRMRQLRSLTLNLRRNNFALATAEACVSDWQQWLEHVEVVTDESVPSYGVLASTTPEQAPAATSTPTKATGASSAKQDGTHFHPQLAMLCLCCTMMGAGYVWWKRSQDPQVFESWIPAGIRDGGPRSPHWTATRGGPPDEHTGSIELQSHDSIRTPMVAGEMAGQDLSMPLAGESYVPMAP